MSPQREQLEVEAEPAVEQAATIVELPAGTSPRSRGLAPARIAFLQRAAGNAAVAAYLQREAADAGAIAERKPPAPGAAAPAQPDGGEHGSEPRGPGHDGREPAPEGSQPPPPVEGADDSGNRAAGEPRPPRHDVGSGANGKTDKDLQLGKHQQDDEAHGAATDSAHEEAESAAEADAPPPPTAGGGLEAAVAAFATPAPLAAPSAEGEGAQTIVDAVAEAGSAGQAALAGTVGGGAREIASTVDSKIAHVDAAAETEDTALASRFSELRKQLGQSVRRASQQVTAAGVAATTRLDTSHNQAAERAGTAFSTRQERTRQLGVTKGDAAVAAGEQAATSAQGRIEGGAGEARDAGERKAGAATGDSSEVIQGKAAAARQVAGDTAGEITRSVDDTVGQLRGIGPESRPQFVDQANQLAAQLGEQLPSILAQLSQTHGDAAGSVDQAAAAGAGSIDQLGATLTRSLAELELNLRRGLRSGAAQSKQSLTAAGREAIASVQREHESAAQAGADLVATVLASVGNRRIRRAAAGEIAAKLALQVRGGYTSTEDMARIGLAQTAQCFATAALEVQEAIRAQAGAARGEAGRFAGDAQGQATAAQVQVAQQLLQMAVSAATAEEGIVSGAERTLDEAVGDLDTRFTTALADLAAQLEQRVGEAVTNAREPLGTLEGRMDEAMQRADERMHESWLEQQIDEAVESIDWGFVAGLVVGLLVTIAVVALLGTGIGALILAGALAGALSVAATTLTNDAIHHRETNWGELGRNMLVGAAFGAIGGAIGGGVSAGLGARVASGVMTEATMIAISKASNVGVGAALGVVQNVIHGDPWDRNLLLNIGTGVAMTYGPGGRAIEGMTETARAGAIDSGLAVESSITPTERAQANARAEARAAGGEGAPPAPAPSPDAAAATSDTGVPAATSDTGVPAATSDTGGPAATSDTGVPAATSDTGGPAATSDTGGPAATSDTGGPAATSDTGGPAATSDTGGPSGGGVTSEPEQGAPRAPRSNTDEPAGAGARDTQPTGFEDEPTVPGGAPVEDEPTTTESGQEAEGRATVEDIASQLPDETVMQPPDPTSAADARLMYDNCMAESPTREAAIYRNTETGEYIVVQGNENTAQVAPGEGPSAGGGPQRWKEILDGRPDVGRWELEAHSHPVPEGGTEVRPADRVPSGASGDMGVMHDESVASGQPRSSRIDFETAAGPDHTTYGYDPAAERPYWVDYPDPITGARQTQRFASIEAYHEFLETRFGVVSEPVPEHMAGRGGGSPGESGAPGAPEATSGGGPDDSTVASGSEETTSTEPSSSAAEDPYADLTLRQLKRLAKTDPQAAEALLDRYRAWRDANDPRLRSAARSDPIAKSILDAPRPNEELAELMGPKGDERPVPHEAGARVRDAQGREKWSGSYESGGMTPEQEALGYPKAQQATHTEAKAIAEAPLGPGETLDITGQYDPCPACRAAMTAASQGGRTVSYWWPGGRFRAVNGTATISFNP